MSAIGHVPLMCRVERILLARLLKQAQVENRPYEQVLQTALRVFLSLPPEAQRTLAMLDAHAPKHDRDYVYQAVGRMAVSAYDKLDQFRTQEETGKSSGGAAGR